MKKRTLLCLVSTVGILSIFNACEDFDETVVVESSTKSVYTHSISMDDALASLQAFLNDSTISTTRSTTNQRKIASIFPVKYQAVATRANSPSTRDCENLLYIANFENNQGFAVLAGDDRIEDEVIAVTSAGSLTNKDISDAIDEMESEERPILDEYPRSGAGFFTVEEYPDELFINPNTVSLHDDQEGDDLVGNFTTDNIGEEDEDGNLVNPNDTCSDEESRQIVSALCVSYAFNEIEDFVIDDGNCGGGGGGSSSSRTVTTTSPWSNVKMVSPILANYKTWSQKSPFNDLYPKKRKYLLFGHRRKAPAGCFPLAISKIMTYFRYPNRYTHNGYTVNWESLNSNYKSSDGAKSAAALLKGISSGCGSWYFYSGTFTFPGKATSYMKFAGYNNARSYNYKYSRVTAMLDNGCPLIIYGIPKINIFKSHSWNIDGYKIKVRTTTTKKYVGEVLKNETTQTDTCKMVHCDFGWDGICNGYYVSGVFKLNDPNADYDNPSGERKDIKYNTLLKIVTYDKPKR